MDKSRITAAIWPWGTETREQMEVAAKEITEIGYTSFESVKQAMYAFDLDLKAYKEVLDRYGLTAQSFYFHLLDKEKEKDIFANLENELEFIAGLGVKRICLQGTGGRPEVMDEGSMAYELDIIGRFAEKTKSFGITSNLHPHRNTWVMYRPEVDNILQNLGPDIISFAPDTAHLVVGKMDPYEVIETYIDRVNFTHFKDIGYLQEGSEGFTAGVEVFSDFVELGTGFVDFPKIFKLLIDHGYDGPLCEELDRPRVSNYVSAKANYEYLLKNYK